MQQVIGRMGLAIRWFAVLAGVALAVTGGGRLLAQSEAEPVERATAPAAPAEPIAAAAYGVLDKYCAGCHQAGQTGTARPHGHFGNVLALDDLVRRGTLVRPGEPEASPVFNMIYSGHAPLGLFQGAPTGEPSAAEVAAIRDWIKQIPAGADSAACSGRKRLGVGHVGQQAAREVAAATWEQQSRLRFVSLVHLADGCLGEDELRRHGDELSAMLASLGVVGARVVDAERTVFVVELAEQGLTRDVWDDLARRFPLARLAQAKLPLEVETATGTALGVMNGDWLAAWFAAQYDGGAKTWADGGASVLQQGPGWLALADLYMGPIGLRRAAGELGLTVQELDQSLRQVGGARMAAAQALRRGAISRADALEVYSALLDGGPGAGAVRDPVPAKTRAMMLALWTDADTYSVGQEATFYVQASDDCHLTLINVDARGRATVLFPSELERENAMLAGVTLVLPAANAPYRFRVTEKGRETLVGICTETARPIDGIWHDFDRLRFTVLGDWADFQMRAYEDAGKPPSSPLARDRGVRRRGSSAPEMLLPEKRGLEPQARAAVSFVVR